MPQEKPVDEAAVEAAEAIWKKKPWPKTMTRLAWLGQVSCIITDAYEPRLTAERAVRKELVGVITHSVDERHNKIFNLGYIAEALDGRREPGMANAIRHYESIFRTALTAAEKLEKQE